MSIQVFTTTVAVSPLPTHTTKQLWKCDATAGAFAMTLADATYCRGAEVCFIKSDAGVNAVTISRAGAQTILGTGGAAQTSLSLATLGKSFTLASDGSNWVVIAAV